MDESLILGADVETGEPVRLGLRERQQGTYIIGKPGTGKTTLIESMVVQDMEAGLGLCVLDPHGDLIDAALARVPADREKDVILLDLADSGFPFGLQLYECRDLTDPALRGRVVAQSVELFEKLWGEKSGTPSWGPELARVLRNCGRTLIENPGYAMTELRRLLLHDGFRAMLTANLQDEQAREFWELEYDPMRDGEQRQLVRSTTNKVDEFLSPIVRPIVGFGRTTVDFREVMDSGKIVFVKLSVGQVGENEATLVGSMIVGQILNAALSRQDIAPSDRRQFNVYADEYHRFSTPAFAQLLEEARKYAVATTLAHQRRGQLDAQNRGATLSAANLVVFAVSGEDGEELAKEFDHTPPDPDVVGQRPRLTIARDAVQHLVTNGHVNVGVTGFVERWLRPISQMSTSLSDGGFTARDTHLEHATCFEDRGVYRASRSSLRSGLEFINAYFVARMEMGTAIGLPEEAALLEQTAYSLRGFIDFAPDYYEHDVVIGSRVRNESFSSDLPNESREALRAFLRTWLARPEATSMAFDAKRQMPVSLMWAWIEADDTVGRQREEHWMHSNQLRYNVDPQTRVLAAHERAFHEGQGLATFMSDLHYAGAKLAETPILVGSGQWEPIYGNPRSYADVEGEVASTLVNLPKYRARARVLEGELTIEHVLHTPEYFARSSDEDALAREGRIRERTRALYCEPLDKVLDRIRRRQHSGDDPPAATRRRVAI